MSELKNYEQLKQDALNKASKLWVWQLQDAPRFVKPVAWLAVGAGCVYAGIDWRF
jgi:hypothetical protein